jgi:hypothetical protein
VSLSEVEKKLAEARKRTTIIDFNGQPWSVTPFHCIVGPIDEHTLHEINTAWGKSWRAKPKKDRRVPRTYCPLLGAFTYVTKYKGWVKNRRAFFKEEASLWYTSNPLIVNEMKLEECSLVVIENGQIIVTNFLDLANIADRSSVYKPGELWLSYAVGGTEPILRFGGSRP